MMFTLSIWQRLDNNPRATGVCDVSVMAPTFKPHKIDSYLTRSPALGFAMALVPKTSDAFKSLARLAYQSNLVARLPEDRVVVNYAPNPGTPISSDVYSLEMQEWLYHCSNKATTLEAIKSGELEVPIIPGKKVVRRETLAVEVQKLLRHFGRPVYVQAETTQGGFATLTIQSDDDVDERVRTYLSWVSDGHFIIAPFVEVLAAVGVTFFADGAQTEPILNIRLPKNVDPHGSTVGTLAPLPSTFADEFASQLRAINKHARVATSYLVSGIPNNQSLLSANVDFVIYEWEDEKRVAFMEFNARLTHFTIISRALYRRLRVVGADVPDYPEFAAKLSQGETPYAVLGNDNIAVDSQMFAGFEDIMRTLRVNGIRLFDGGGIGLLPVRDYFFDPYHPEQAVVGFVFVSEGNNPRARMQSLASLYIKVVKLLGGENAYYGEVDDLL